MSDVQGAMTKPQNGERKKPRRRNRNPRKNADPNLPVENNSANTPETNTQHSPRGAGALKASWADQLDEENKAQDQKRKNNRRNKKNSNNNNNNSNNNNNNSKKDGGDQKNDSQKTDAEEKKDWGFDKETQTRKFNIIKDESTDFIEILDYNIINILQEEAQLESLYGRRPKVTATEIYDLLPRLRTLVANNDMSSGYELTGIKLLVTYVDAVFEEFTSKYDDMLGKGVISYDGLSFVFKKDSKAYVVDKVLDQKIAFKVTRVEYVRNFFSNFFRITGNAIRTDGKKLMKCAETHVIGSYKGVRKLTELVVKPMTEEVMTELTARGQIFKKYALGHHYLSFKGNMFQESYWQTILFKAIPEEDLWCTYPFVHGFSFVAKKWGEIAVNQLAPIAFDDTAFEKLVLPADKKKLISALVSFQDRAFTDIISGKGGGCIFLLHGSPGVGKTLTAESIAELMHRPLYSVSVGELGTTPDSLEENLGKILELAATWKAVILLDEADIFLEKRSEHDIMRNAMVGIFLRLLEYHQGVLFLTTNRVKNFDPAFHSRISVALKYHDLDAEAREKIWKNLMGAAQVTGIDPKAFSHHDINGRQIKNSIRLAQALAASEGRTISTEFLEQTIEVARQFQTDLLESIVVSEAHEVLQQKVIADSVKEETSKLRVSAEIIHPLHKSGSIEKK